MANQAGQNLTMYTQVKSLFQRVTQFVDPEDFQSRKPFSNLVYLILPFVYLVFMLVDYKAYLEPLNSLKFDQFIVPIEMMICWFCFFLNQKQYFRLAKFLFILTWPWLMHLIPIMLYRSPLDYFMAFPAGLIFHGVLIQLIFSRKHDPWSFWLLLTANLTVTLLAPTILEINNPEQYQLPGIVKGKYYFLVILLYWLLFNLLVYYLIFSIEKFLSEAMESRRVILEQKEALEDLTRNQEATIRRRTRELEKSNKQLTELAFYNAHLLRGPFCRIQGLLNLETHISDPEERDKIRELLLQSIDELESRIGEIQTIVDLNDPDPDEEPDQN